MRLIIVLQSIVIILLALYAAYAFMGREREPDPVSLPETPLTEPITEPTPTPPTVDTATTSSARAEDVNVVPPNDAGMEFPVMDEGVEPQL